MMISQQIPDADSVATDKPAPSVPPLWRLVTRRGSVIAPLNEGGEGPAFYCVHSIFGDVSSLHPLVRALSAEQRFLGLQVPKSKMNAAFVPSVEELARHHVQALTAHQPEGPVVLGGWSAGAIIALEMARQLRALGREVPLLVAMDGAPCNTGAGLPRWHPLYNWALLRNLPGWVRHHILLSESPAALARAIGEKIVFRLRTRLPSLRGVQTLDGGTVRSVLATGGWQSGQEAFVRALYDALRVYVPAPYEGRVVVYEARTQPLDHLMQVGAAWKALAPHAEIVPLEGIHERLLREPAVGALAGHLRTRLAEVRSMSGRAALKPHPPAPCPPPSRRS